MTSDTSIVLTSLSDSVCYSVMLRKQCRYCTSNYDTIVYGNWLSPLSIGSCNFPDTTGGGEGIALPDGEEFLLYPNPVHGSVQVVLPPSAVGGRLLLCDLSGREMVGLDIRNTKVEIDVSSFPAGAYLVKLSTPRGVSVRRLLVE